MGLKIKSINWLDVLYQEYTIFMKLVFQSIFIFYYASWFYFFNLWMELKINVIDYDSNIVTVFQ